jgi:hypothetical protein
MRSFRSKLSPTMIGQSMASQGLYALHHGMLVLQFVDHLFELVAQLPCEVLHSSCALPSDFSSIFDAVDDRARPTCDSFAASQ